MTGGFTGKILRLNLTNHTTSIMNTSDYEDYAGGIGIGTAIFWDLCADKLPLDPFDPDNVVTVMTSPLSGTLVPGVAGRTEINGIGPQAYPIGWYTRSNFGGRFSGELKHAGWDGIVIEGKSDSQTWVKIVDDNVTFEDASPLWGLDTWTTQEEIWADASAAGYGRWIQTGPGLDSGRTTQRPAVLCIGPLGEVMARDMGCLIHDAGNGAGQGGLGSVWGSKNLKAISVIGTGDVEIADPDALMEARLWAWNYQHRLGDPTKAGPSRFGKTVAASTATQRSQGCMSCANPCRNRFSTGIRNESQCVENMYYGGLSGLKNGPGSVEELKASDVVQKYGCNVYPLGISMDNGGFRYLNILSQMGELGPGKAIDTDLPLDLLGDAHFVEVFLDKIVNGEDIGLDLREGFVRASVKWGRYDEDQKSNAIFFPYWGYPEHMYDTRGSLEWGYGSIMAERDINEHCYNYWVYWYPRFLLASGQFPVGAEECAQIASSKMYPFEGEMRMFDYSTENMYSEHIVHLVAWQKFYTSFWKHSVQYCDWSWPDLINVYGPNNVGLSGEAEPKFYNAVTGSNISWEDGIEMGKKIWNMRNAIWVLQGRHRDMAVFQDHIYDQPLYNPYPGPTYIDGVWNFTDVGGRNLDRDKFEDWKTLFYECMGWNTSNGWPTRSTLEGMDLGFVADTLESKGKLG